MMEELNDHYEGLCEARRAGEVTLSQGVLTIELGAQGTYVLNKQAPNKQIWLSSPKSGPRRFEFHLSTDQWVCNREGMTLLSLLKREIDEA